MLNFNYVRDMYKKLNILSFKKHKEKIKNDYVKIDLAIKPIKIPDLCLS